MKRNRQSTGRTSLALWLAVLLLVCSMLAGCGNAADSENQNEQATKIVTDCLGRQVEIPQQVERVACLYAFSGHVTALLGESDKMVATVNGLKRDKLLTDIFPEILNLPTPFEQDRINIEALMVADPEVVFVRESTYNNSEEMKKLESFGVPVVVIDSNTMEEQRKAVQAAAEVFGQEAQQRAAQYDSMYRQALEFAEKAAMDIPEDSRKRLYHSINEATRTDIQGTLSAEWKEAVGVNNVALGESLNPLDGKAYANLEQIYVWDPEIIICNEALVPVYIMTDSKWAELSAAKNAKVYQMPVGISRWGHPGSMETPLAIYWLGNLLYPEMYSSELLESKTREFYQTFFDRELTEEEMQAILAGEGMRADKNQAPVQ